jgi:hypothetical protein
VNLCRSCGEDFGSVSAFDAHRVGKQEHPFGPAHPDGRRCLSIVELRERGWTEDGRGRWRRASDGAPWASSEDQVTTETGRDGEPKASGRLRRARGSTRLPDRKKVRSAND